MVERKVGERARILFDDIDLRILKTLNNYESGLSVGELVDKLELNHKNLKPHIDKLSRLDLIFAFKDSLGKAKFMTIIRNMDQLTEQEFFSEKQYYEALENVKIQIGLIDFLEKANSLYYEDEVKKAVDLDIRKLKRHTKTTDLQIGALSKKENEQTIRMNNIAEEDSIEDLNRLKKSVKEEYENKKLTKAQYENKIKEYDLQIKIIKDRISK